MLLMAAHMLDVILNISLCQLAILGECMLWRQLSPCLATLIKNSALEKHIQVLIRRYITKQIKNLIFTIS